MDAIDNDCLCHKSEARTNEKKVECKIVMHIGKSNVQLYELCNACKLRKYAFNMINPNMHKHTQVEQM